ncbi:hypothetical protein Fmac_006012 [Flemingia macrophylla]|uniref:Bet v I/Major latex protein domain-containing protein n=1 Tax=Flemingia macrophylla TaxID=520843 RepID=A0ABD1N9F3_9FABA
MASLSLSVLQPDAWEEMADPPTSSASCSTQMSQRHQSIPSPPSLNSSSISSPETLKERVEFDDENKKISFIILEGDMLKYYKSYKVILHVLPKGEHSLVNWTFLYEKMDDTAPETTKYKDLMVKVTKNLEAHLNEAQ